MGVGVSGVLCAREVEREGSLTLEGEERPERVDLVPGWKARSPAVCLPAPGSRTAAWDVG